jgi:hypothetical protein
MTRCVRLLRRKASALRTIGEAEAYARCHGDRGLDILSVDPVPPPPLRRPAPNVTGETLRRAFEDRLRSRSGPST